MKNKFKQIAMRKTILLSLYFQFLILSSLLAQNVSVSPSRFYYKTAPGETKKQILHVTNSSPDKQSFTISFADFSATGINGKTQMLKPGESEHSCSNYMSASPSFFE